MIDIDRIKNNGFSAVQVTALTKNLRQLGFIPSMYGEYVYKHSVTTDDGVMYTVITVYSKRITKAVYNAQDIMVNATQESFNSIDFAEVIEEFLVQHYEK